MVSFDIESLFTNVPVTESCRIVSKVHDDTLPDRTPLTPDEIHDLMYFCLNSTSFKWRDNYYQQLQGAAMGSPLSPVIANIFMEHFETTALQTLSQRPSLWLRYVDDTFVIWPHNRRDLGHFLAHINQHHPSIKFTMETEQNNSTPSYTSSLPNRHPASPLTKSTGNPHTPIDIFATDPSTVHTYYNQSTTPSSAEPINSAMSTI
ncbi:uncharacterized protein LOC100889582 [Strongylocentrotus purpuratus]|uniref:Reverse transcriptase domain-containing protein n=1 Tax=Strongylocentrotus purpuratus TaxID=7668 RepID=A0A7M7LL63_STRPU|nr:uncharacterized protein LOC100889582 [Strongylocentrotus purpuratus]|eukprot:XP_003724886.1 PREDICTED: uncharacterized protein LOC100889582 [Strongylocentrotus purpuratus]